MALAYEDYMERRDPIIVTSERKLYSMWFWENICMLFYAFPALR
jgi:hypothetical protein